MKRTPSRRAQAFIVATNALAVATVLGLAVGVPVALTAGDLTRRAKAYYRARSIERIRRQGIRRRDTLTRRLFRGL
ncbi:hypothetical protein A2856_02820 [Candidatus Uhrbacteria bacterium RIFCSPHIGHO2_01_FULL_63_20]|uniref:Uncharacterized protein n=1 Tax=Candidatus Uhrbacteria bacterium RIFCSPHIGHO2_01_FULL_63_20 TaxID=1802385 RepID=A0A1F7TKU4_9BACT|nr:MAG: hypothetical protein A2856_02820 [Candidatus Uhrbacteria bacterium RIFCSPHIGHO2_01_FULL_63_20]